MFLPAASRHIRCLLKISLNLVMKGSNWVGRIANPAFRYRTGLQQKHISPRVWGKLEAQNSRRPPDLVCWELIHVGEEKTSHIFASNSFKCLCKEGKTCGSEIYRQTFLGTPIIFTWGIDRSSITATFHHHHNHQFSFKWRITFRYWAPWPLKAGSSNKVEILADCLLLSLAF